MKSGNVWNILGYSGIKTMGFPDMDGPHLSHAFLSLCSTENLWWPNPIPILIGFAPDVYIHNYIHMYITDYYSTYINNIIIYMYIYILYYVYVYVSIWVGLNHLNNPTCVQMSSSAPRPSDEAHWDIRGRNVSRGLVEMYLQYGKPRKMAL